MLTLNLLSFELVICCLFEPSGSGLGPRDLQAHWLPVETASGHGGVVSVCGTHGQPVSGRRYDGTKQHSRTEVSRRVGVLGSAVHKGWMLDTDSFFHRSTAVHALRSRGYLVRPLQLPHGPSGPTALLPPRVPLRSHGHGIRRSALLCNQHEHCVQFPPWYQTKAPQHCR